MTRGTLFLWTMLLTVTCARPGAADAGPNEAAPATPGLVEKTVKSLGSTKGMFGPPALSLDGDRIAYRYYASGEKPHIVLDEVPQLPYDSVGVPCFSSDSKRLGYFAIRGALVYLVCDGKEIPIFGEYPFAFSPDGKHVACVVKGAGGDPVIACDGVPHEKMPARQRAVFSPDSSHLAYQAGYAPTRYIVCDGRKFSQSFDDVGLPCFSPDGRKLAYAACQNNQWGVLCGAMRTGPYDEVGQLAFSPDGARLAFKARRARKWFIVGDKGKESLFDDVRDPVFSLLGGRLAYAATDRKGWFIVRDGVKGAGYAEVSDPVFSFDGKHLAHHATRDGKPFLVCDGMERELPGKVSWVGFSPDGRHLAVVAAKGASQGVLCDGVESPEHAMVFVPEHFDDIAGRLRYVVIDKEQASLVEVAWPADRAWEDAFKPAAPAAK